ncbi:MAG: TVP38/TMEM64 family protein [Microcystaceae cyanobacterium]
MTIKLNKWLKYCLISFAVASVIIVAKQIGLIAQLQAFLESTLQWIDGLGSIGIAVFMIIYIISTIFWIPGTILTLGAGFLYGVIQGSILVSVASTMAGTAAFLIGRYFAREKVDKIIASQPKFQAIDEAVAQEGWKIVGLTRLSPLFPFVFLNYAFGLTKVSLKDFFLASWIGMLPGTVLYVYIGSLAKDVATLGGDSSSASLLQWLLRLVGFGATVAVTVYITKIARKALDSQIKEPKPLVSSSR